MRARAAGDRTLHAFVGVCLALSGCQPTPFPEVPVELGAGPPAAAPRAAQPPPLRFSVAAMLSPEDTFAAYSQLLDRLGVALGVPVELVQRRSYREVNDLLVAGKVDAAILCTGGYLELERRHPGSTEVLAVPVIRGQTTYRSYLIVPADSRTLSLADLEGKRFAFTDELSLSGRQWILKLLRSARRDPESFFGSVQLTGSHDRSIDAVARRVVDGAAVDSLVFEHLVAARPELAAATRVILRSPRFGAAPVVASTHLPEPRRAELRRALLSLARDQEAAGALRRAGFDTFEVAPPHHFDAAAEVVEGAR